MRYVRFTTHYRYETLHLAESLFERFVGRRIALDMYEETVPIVRSRGQLAHTPVSEILSIKARCEGSAYVPWALDGDVACDYFDASGHIALPSTLFGESYTSARIAYLAGYDEIPADVEACVLEIAQAIDERRMDEWSGMSALSDEAQATINKFRERR